MKLICLNLWGGKLYEPLLDFIRGHAGDTDVFCFQEYENINAELPGHTGYFYSNLALFIKKDIIVESSGGQTLYSGDPFVGKTVGLVTGVFQYAQLVHAGAPYCIGNIHGLWQEHKDDTPERLDQSHRLIEFFKKQAGTNILVGDFNLRPDTESIALISKEMKNLIAQYRVTVTRTSEYQDMEKWKDYIADYVFVSPDTAVKDFKVLPDIISDHAPLMLEFQ